jgi:hypothetical protein
VSAGGKVIFQNFPVPLLLVGANRFSSSAPGLIEKIETSAEP